MHEVTLQGEDRTVCFRGQRRPLDPDPYSGSGFTVEVAAQGLKATVPVFMYGFDWKALVEFFAGMAVLRDEAGVVIGSG